MARKTDRVIIFDLTMTHAREVPPEDAVSILFNERGIPLFWADPVHTYKANLEHLPDHLAPCRGDGVFLVPPAIRMHNAAPRFRPIGARPSRTALFERDDYTCQYCGKLGHRSTLTLDHVMPISRGGGFTWTNLVTACQTCNVRKGNRTPEEAGMPLNNQPIKPTPGHYLMKLQKLWEDLSQ